MSTPEPISHKDSAVGRPPTAPHGVPLSTRIRAGRPQRAKARRRTSWAASAPTRAQVPRGENRGPEDRAAALVGHPQPTGLPAHQGQVLAGVHLPDVVRVLGAPVDPAGGPPGRRGAQPGLSQPALQSAGGGDRMPQAAQVDADELRSPLGVVTAQVQGSLEDGLPLGRARARPGPVGGDQRGIVAGAEPRDQGSHGALGEAESLSDLSGRLPVSPSCTEDEADGDGDRARHRSAPVRMSIGVDEHQHKASFTARQNPMSRFHAKLHVV
jgi:hypothetical protein